MVEIGQLNGFLTCKSAKNEAVYFHLKKSVLAVLRRLLFATLLALTFSERPAIAAAPFELSGNSFFTSAQLYSILDLPVSPCIPPALLTPPLNRLTQFYLEHGFCVTLNLQTASPDDSCLRDAVLDINEGERRPIIHINLQGAAVLSEAEIRRQLQLYPGDYCTSVRLKQAVTSLLALYTNQGFTFAEVSVTISVNNAGLSLNFEIREGNRCFIAGIQTAKAGQTKPAVLQKLLGLPTGALFSASLLARGRQRIERQPYIQQVRDIRPIAISADSVILEIDLTEARFNQGEAAIGYAPAAGDQKGYFTGYAKLQFGNLFGTARRFSVDWQKLRQKQEDVSLSYVEPWLPFVPVAARITFSRSLLDTLYSKTDTSLRLEADFRQFLSGFVAFQTARGQEKTAFVQRTDTKNQLSWGLRLDSRDFPPNPHYGLDYQLSWSLGQRRFSDQTRLATERTLHLRLGHFIPLGKRIILYHRIALDRYHGAAKNIPYYDQFPLGGAQSLRGYAERQFRGTEVAWINTEFRYCLTKLSRAFLFMDAGHYKFDRWRDPYLGYGLGISLESKAGLFGIIYGLGRDDSLNNGKLHFQLENAF